MTAVAALGLIVGGFMLASCGGDGDDVATQTETMTTTTTETATVDTTTTTETTSEPTGPTVVRVTVVNGEPEGGIVRETVEKGDRVLLVVTSDVSDRIHLHGYDLTRDVAPARPARLRFEATIPGRFEVELEDRGVQIADLSVTT